MEVHDITLAGKKRGHHPWFALAASDHPSQQEEVRTVGKINSGGFSSFLNLRALKCHTF